MKTRRRKHESTAYHEAGHAVAAFVLRLKIGRRGVTIVPDKERDMLGYANVTAQLRGRPDCATSARTRAGIEAWAVAHLAGDVAERKFNGRRRFGGHSDLLHASDLLGLRLFELRSDVNDRALSHVDIRGPVFVPLPDQLDGVFAWSQLQNRRRVTMPGSYATNYPAPW